MNQFVTGLVSEEMLKTGYAFRASLPEGSPKQHVCVLVNLLDSGNHYGYLIFTSQVVAVELLTRNKDPHSVAYFGAEDVGWAFIECRPCCIRCDLANIHIIKKTSLITNLQSGEFEHVAIRTPSTIMSRIIEAVKGTKTLTNKEKNMIVENIFVEYPECSV